MKRNRRSSIYVLTLLFTLAGLAAASALPFTLTLAPPEQPLKAGSTLHLRLTVTNRSDHQTSFPTNWGLFDPGKIYQVHVLDELGRPVPGRTLPCERPGQHCAGGSAQGRYLKPGESFTDEVNVTLFYDLSRPGKYKIWVAEDTFGRANLPNGLVTSNVVMVTVVK